MDNAAFVDRDREYGGREDECSRILQRLAQQIQCGEINVGDQITLHDVYGNAVGAAYVDASRHCAGNLRHPSKSARQKHKD